MFLKGKFNLAKKDTKDLSLSNCYRFSYRKQYSAYEITSGVVIVMHFLSFLRSSIISRVVRNE